MQIIRKILTVTLLFFTIIAVNAENRIFLLDTSGSMHGKGHSFSTYGDVMGDVMDRLITHIEGLPESVNVVVVTFTRYQEKTIKGSHKEVIKQLRNLDTNTGIYTDLREIWKYVEGLNHNENNVIFLVSDGFQNVSPNELALNRLAQFKDKASNKEFAYLFLVSDKQRSSDLAKLFVKSPKMDITDTFEVYPLGISNGSSAKPAATVEEKPVEEVAVEEAVKEEVIEEPVEEAVEELANEPQDSVENVAEELADDMSDIYEAPKRKVKRDNDLASILLDLWWLWLVILIILLIVLAILVIKYIKANSRHNSYGSLSDYFGSDENDSTVVHLDKIPRPTINLTKAPVQPEEPEEPEEPQLPAVDEKPAQSDGTIWIDKMSETNIEELPKSEEILPVQETTDPNEFLSDTDSLPTEDTTEIDDIFSSPDTLPIEEPTEDEPLYDADEPEDGADETKDK